MAWPGVAAVLLLSAWANVGLAADKVYEGTWKTVNRRLDGRMTCEVKDLGKDKWEGRFYGVWQGVDFDYTVKWSGPYDKLKGTATIDGAHYDWTGKMKPESPGTFEGTFTGSRYNGSFDLKEKERKPAKLKRGAAS